ncbi:MerR family transcriptional regulator [Listeria newyorkensis]|uniref:MerR family transcriptional regulator n=1 Tax=Listeria newyorkensis TaxID=1497681 RepID=A0ABX4XY21_9LIST|nr:MerR family transcriptional regulator [Listeria newyorkensis]KGL43814.1 MerR family transcriptional regulator [Listeria newyorkensis]KMT61710.1 MerR family transcriptional regulator [Listeria newyorkensis]PNP95049.1 MerR family transcriptional regulator [Listeria newyorkensis]WAO21982.1 MerR family transcriptional regulator [Listeria newyorkensis]SQC59082.1 Multidrug transporter activation protein [Listeria newyorkensis]
MEYTVQKLGQLAGVSTRTLRYYDEIGILKPARINSSGYRIYGQTEVDRLQQIMFYREMNVSLEKIKAILEQPDFNEAEALRKHRVELLDKRKQLDDLIRNVEKSIAYSERRMTMTDQEKFEGFKQKMIDDNEEKYGAEIRGKYGDEKIDRSNAKLKGMSEAEMERINQLAETILADLQVAFETGDPAGEKAQAVAAMHKEWLSAYWDTYSKEAHAGLAQMYVDDERFTAYYDKKQPGLAAFLRDAIVIFTSK